MYKRKCLNINIKKEMQLRIFSWILLMVIISSFVSGGIFYYYSNRQINSNYRQFHVQLHNMRQVLMPWILVAIGVGASLALGLAMFYPKKIAGPLYRLEKRIQGIASGNLNEQVRLRSNDELQDLAREINQMGTRLQERLLLAKNAALALELIIDKDLPKDLSEGVTTKLKNESAKLRQIFDEFNI